MNTADVCIFLFSSYNMSKGSKKKNVSENRVVISCGELLDGGFSSLLLN